MGKWDFLPPPAEIEAMAKQKTKPKPGRWDFLPPPAEIEAMTKPKAKPKAGKWDFLPPPEVIEAMPEPEQKEPPLPTPSEMTSLRQSVEQKYSIQGPSDILKMPSIVFEKARELSRINQAIQAEQTKAAKRSFNSLLRRYAQPMHPDAAAKIVEQAKETPAILRLPPQIQLKVPNRVLTVTGAAPLKVTTRRTLAGTSRLTPQEEKLFLHPKAVEYRHGKRGRYEVLDATKGGVPIWVRDWETGEIVRPVYELLKRGEPVNISEQDKQEILLRGTTMEEGQKQTTKEAWGKLSRPFEGIIMALDTPFRVPGAVANAVWENLLWGTAELAREAGLLKIKGQPQPEGVGKQVLMSVLGHDPKYLSDFAVKVWGDVKGKDLTPTEKGVATVAGLLADIFIGGKLFPRVGDLPAEQVIGGQVKRSLKRAGMKIQPETAARVGKYVAEELGQPQKIAKARRIIRSLAEDAGVDAKLADNTFLKIIGPEGERLGQGGLHLAGSTRELVPRAPILPKKVPESRSPLGIPGMAKPEPTVLSKVKEQIQWGSSLPPGATDIIRKADALREAHIWRAEKAAREMERKLARHDPWLTRIFGVGVPMSERVALSAEADFLQDRLWDELGYLIKEGEKPIQKAAQKAAVKEVAEEMGKAKGIERAKEIEAISVLMRENPKNALAKMVNVLKKNAKDEIKKMFSQQEGVATKLTKEAREKIAQKVEEARQQFVEEANKVLQEEVSRGGRPIEGIEGLNAAQMAALEKAEGSGMPSRLAKKPTSLKEKEIAKIRQLARRKVIGFQKAMEDIKAAGLKVPKNFRPGAGYSFVERQIPAEAQKMLDMYMMSMRRMYQEAKKAGIGIEELQGSISRISRKGGLYSNWREKLSTIAPEFEPTGTGRGGGKPSFAKHRLGIEAGQSIAAKKTGAWTGLNRDKFYKRLGEIYAGRKFAHANAIASAKLENELLPKYGIPIDNDITRMALEKRMSPRQAARLRIYRAKIGKFKDQQFLVDEQLEKLLTRANEVRTNPNAFWRWYDHTMGWWKGRATIIRPGFAVRNILGGNTVQLWLADVSPSSVKQAAQILAGYKALDPFRQVPRMRRRWWTRLLGIKPSKHVAGKPVQEWLRLLDENKVLSGGWSAIELQSIGKSGKNILADVARGLNPMGAHNYPMRLVRSVNELGEDLGRLAVFIDRVKKGYTLAEAVQAVARFIFNYDELSGMMRGMRRVYPFWTWPYKAWGQALWTALHKPDKFAKLYRLKTGIESLDPENVQDAILWSYMEPKEKEYQQYLRIPYVRGEHGERQYAPLANLMPLVNLTQLEPGNIPQTMMEGVYPLPRFLIHEISGLEGQQKFAPFGVPGEIYDPGLVNAPSALGLEKYLFTPQYNNIEYRKNFANAISQGMSQEEAHKYAEEHTPVIGYKWSRALERVISAFDPGLAKWISITKAPSEYEAYNKLTRMLSGMSPFSWGMKQATYAYLHDIIKHLKAIPGVTREEEQRGRNIGKGSIKNILKDLQFRLRRTP